MKDLHAELFCDPYATGLWRHRPLLIHISYAFPELDWTVRPVVAFPDPLAGQDASAHAEAARHAAATADLPIADNLFADGIPASWGACEALTAVREIAPDSAFTLLHHLTSRIFATGATPQTPDTLAAIAKGVSGVDDSVVHEGVGSRRAAAAVGRDIERGRDLFARLNTHEVRGNPKSVPLVTQIYDDGRENDMADPRRSLETDNTNARGQQQDAKTATATDDTETEEPKNDARAGPQIPRIPLVRLVAGDYTVVIDPREGFDEFVDVLRRYDPDLGELNWQAKIHGRHVMQAYGMPKRTAEHLSGEQYPEKVRAILTEVDEAFTADIAACADLSPVTCRIALRKLHADEHVERTNSGSWSLAK